MSLDKLQDMDVNLEPMFLSQKKKITLSTNRCRWKEGLLIGQVCAELSVLGVQ